MKKRIVKKRKIRLRKKRIIIILMLFAAIFFYDYYSNFMRVKNIYIKNNNYLSDQEIIELAELEDYPNYYFISPNQVAANIENHILVNKVEVKRKFFQQLEIKVAENYPVLYLPDSEQFFLSNGEIVAKGNMNIIAPIMSNKITPECMCTDIFYEEMTKINMSTLDYISEIRYAPNEVDKQRFLLHMNDSNQIYVTVYTMAEKLNSYQEFLETLGEEHGYIYLDYGNVFIPYEKK